jgi:hypothetical protein
VTSLSGRALASWKVKRGQREQEGNMFEALNIRLFGEALSLCRSSDVYHHLSGQERQEAVLYCYDLLVNGFRQAT